MADEEFWCPSLINRWRGFLGQGIPNEGTLQHRYAFLSNLGYTLQYLEFLNYQIQDTRLHATVSTQAMKSFIVNGMGVIEAICWYLLKKNKCEKLEEWEQVAERQAVTFKSEAMEYRVTNVVERKLPEPVESPASLQWMIRRVERKKLLGIDGQVYKDLNYLRNLRNKVHLHVASYDTDTDWNAFNKKEFKLMKKSLYGMFTSEAFSSDAAYNDMVGFLRVDEPTEELVSELPF